MSQATVSGAPHARRTIVGRLRLAAARPEIVLAALLTLFLGALVVVPLVELVRETLTVQPYDRAYLPKATPGDFTLFHY